MSYECPEAKRYKVFVGKGNNSKLVKAVFQNRFWWTVTDKEAEANLVWTQKAKKKVFATILDCETDPIKPEDTRNLEPTKRKIKVKRR